MLVVFFVLFPMLIPTVSRMRKSELPMFEPKKGILYFYIKSVVFFSTNFRDTSLKNYITSLAAVAESYGVFFSSLRSETKTILVFFSIIKKSAISVLKDLFFVRDSSKKLVLV